jgi:hypothetical protein
MREVHVISIIALIYSILLALVSFIFFDEYLLWAILGSAVAMFNHSLMIQVTKKNNFNAQRLVAHLVQRYVFYLIIIFYVYLQTKDLGRLHMIYSYIFMLLGIFSIKIGVFVYHMPFIKKPKDKEVTPDAPTDSQSDLK